MDTNNYEDATDFMTNGDYVSARERFQRYLDIDNPTSVEACYYISCCNLCIHHYDGFLNKHWLELSFTTPKDFIEKLFNLINNDIKKLDKILKDDIANIEALRRRGMLYLYMLHTNKALVDFEKAYKLGDTHPEMYYGLGYACHVASNHSDAVKYFDMFIEQEPDYVYAYYFRGVSNFEIGEYKRTVEDHDKVIKNNIEHYGSLLSTRSRALSYLRNARK